MQCLQIANQQEESRRHYVVPKVSTTDLEAVHPYIYPWHVLMHTEVNIDCKQSFDILKHSMNDLLVLYTIDTVDADFSVGLNFANIA